MYVWEIYMVSFIFKQWSSLFLGCGTWSTGNPDQLLTEVYRGRAAGDCWVTADVVERPVRTGQTVSGERGSGTGCWGPKKTTHYSVSKETQNWRYVYHKTYVISKYCCCLSISLFSSLLYQKEKKYNFDIFSKFNCNGQGQYWHHKKFKCSNKYTQKLFKIVVCANNITFGCFDLQVILTISSQTPVTSSVVLATCRMTCWNWIHCCTKSEALRSTYNSPTYSWKMTLLEHSRSVPVWNLTVTFYTCYKYRRTGCICWNLWLGLSSS